MHTYKRFKDPIYGYLDIPIRYVNEIIDTSTFQRLRRIIQTSYSVLYSSSVHNRFIHSMGVYHLGQIASTYLVSCLKDKKQTKDLANWDKVKEVFDLACLLHDVGHAPFSHTGEKFFLDNVGRNKYEKIHTILMEVVGGESFKKDVPNNESESAAPHEIMSAIIGIKNFEQFFPTIELKELFARCITGYKYSDNYDLHSIYNCFISLLNSKVIDVDKLDYLIRDAYFSGYQSVNIDYQRLLTSLTIIVKESIDEKEEEGERFKLEFCLGYKKHAISIIENVVYAHDAEKKWIQTHPIVLYEMYILQHIMQMLDKAISTEDQKLFSLETLSDEGLTFDSIGKIALISDDDIVFLLKNQALNDSLCREFFSRTERRHPLWKSAAEYKAYFVMPYGDGGEIMTRFISGLDETEKYLKKFTDSWVIKAEIIKKLEEELVDIEKEYEQAITESQRRSFSAQKETKKLILAIMKCLQEYALSKDCDCDFIILNANEFYSGFNKDEFEKIQIEFIDKHYEFKDVVSKLSSDKTKLDKFFYLFYKNNKELKKEELCQKLYSSVMSIH